MAANVSGSATSSDVPRKKARNRRYCCVYECHNQEGFDENIVFYTFPSKPYEVERRQRWVQAVRRTRPDGTPWQPTGNTRICSTHFVGNATSNCMHHPAYVPTIFPSAYRRAKPCDASSSVERFERWTTRAQSSANPAHPTVVVKDGNGNGLHHSSPDEMDVEIPMEAAKDTSEQLQPLDLSKQRGQNAPPATKALPENSAGLTAHSGKIDEHQGNVACKATSGTADTFEAGSLMARNLVVLHRAVGPDTRVCYFGGYDAVCRLPGGIRHLCGVDDNVFALLLSLFPDVREKTSDVSLPNKLIIFLFKMKHGLPFSAMAVLFGIHETTAARIFHAVLGTLAYATSGWIYRLDRYVTQKTLPDCFKVNYPKCTLIVDCTEVRTESPSEVRQQHVLFSTYKNGFTLKFLVAIAPSGFIVFKSKAYGGRCTDTHVVVNSGFLEVVEEGDVILADKGFPGIRAGVSGKSGVLIMPPFSAGSQQFSEADTSKTYEIAQVRIHVERVIQRIKTHGIFQHRFPISLIPAATQIFHMACVLANLQNPVIKADTPS